MAKPIILYTLRTTAIPPHKLTERRYRHEIIGADGEPVKGEVTGSPYASQWLRDRLAELNTRLILDLP